MMEEDIQMMSVSSKKTNGDCTSKGYAHNPPSQTDETTEV